MKRQNKPIDGLSTVYVATNETNGDRYIGITCGFLSQRKAKHRRSALITNSQAHFHRAIRKYGWDNFRFDVASKWVSYDEAKQEEVRLIAMLAPEYNMTVGGDGCFGYKHTPEMCAEISRRNTGRPGYWKGKKIPQHVADNLKRIREARTDKARVLAMGPKSMQKRVVCLNDGLEFECAGSAARHYGVGATMISSCCNRKRNKTVKGLVFRFFGDHLGGFEEAESVKNAISAMRKDTHPTYKRAVLDSMGNVFETVKDAAHHYGITPTRVRRSATGGYHNVANDTHRFKYAQGSAVGGRP